MLVSRTLSNGKSTTKHMRGNVFLLSAIFTIDGHISLHGGFES